MAQYVLRIADWHPATLNQLLSGVRKRIRLKKADRDLVGWYARLAGIPSATGKRRVSLRLTLGPRQRGADPDAYWKSLLDALVSCGLLVNDTPRWVELGPVSYRRGQERATEVTLEELDNGEVAAP
jgi:hypothetical protein